MGKPRSRQANNKYKIHICKQSYQHIALIHFLPYLYLMSGGHHVLKTNFCSLVTCVTSNDPKTLPAYQTRRRQMRALTNIQTQFGQHYGPSACFLSLISSSLKKKKIGKGKGKTTTKEPDNKGDNFAARIHCR